MLKSIRRKLGKGQGKKDLVVSWSNRRALIKSRSLVIGLLHSCHDGHTQEFKWFNVRIRTCRQNARREWNFIFQKHLDLH